jgi:hypothetical protein
MGRAQPDLVPQVVAVASRAATASVTPDCCRLRPALKRIRTEDGGLLPGVEIKPQPNWHLSLEYKNRDAWRPLLRPLIELSGLKSAATSATLCEKGIHVFMTVTTSVTLPRVDNLEPAEAVAFELLRKTGTPILDYKKFVFGFDPNAAAH